MKREDLEKIGLRIDITTTIKFVISDNLLFILTMLD